MKGDFSRIRFDATDHFSRVLLQQGRVTLDSDPNEQTAILLHYLRTLARDIIGPCGGPTGDVGFQLSLETVDGSPTPRLVISSGRYYVDGILVENDADTDYAGQPDFKPPSTDPVLQRLIGQNNLDMFLYLDVWEQHVTCIEDDAIREVALGGPDTTTRAKVVWQVRGVALNELRASMTARRDALDARLADEGLDDETRARLQQQRDKLEAAIVQLEADPNANRERDCAAPIVGLSGLSDAHMVAQVDPGQQSKDPCLAAPDARYRGAENQLYRVEIHRGSGAGSAPTFKWSRDNGSVAARWLATDGNDLIVSSNRGFSRGTWVELTHDAHERDGQRGLMVKLVNVQADRLSVDPDSIPSGATLALPSGATHTKVRRWDQTETEDITLDEGAVPIAETTSSDPHWLDLEDGIQVRFEAGGTYRTGDYWLVPARVATGSIDWPHARDAGGDIEWFAQPPHGVEHHYAPLGYLAPNSDNVLDVSPCVCEFEPINDCTRQAVREAPRAPRPRVTPVRTGRAARPAAEPKKPKS
jgi:hypothetical protein